MNFEQWLKANGYDAEALTKPEMVNQRKHLEAAFKAETAPPVKPPESSNFSDTMKAISDESARVEYIQKATAHHAERHVGNPEKIKQISDLGTAAIADKKMSNRDFDLAMIQVDRMLPPMSFAPQGAQQLNEDLLEAAICMTCKLPDLEKKFSDQSLQAAHTKFRRGIKLNEMLAIAAERNNGYRGSTSDHAALSRAAFSHQHMGYGGMMASSPSTINVAGILSNVANKFLASGWLYGEQSWRQISQIKPASDFKQMSIYRLTGSNKFEKVPAGGEIKHGTLSELTYTLQVETYGKQLGIDRRDLINDDLGAFTGASAELSRGAIDSLNEVFWTEYLDDSTFYNTDKSKGNYDDGAVDSVLSLAGLENADAIFAAQTKPDGTPLGATPTILLVPRGLRARASTLNRATGIVGQGADAAPVPDENPWAGMFNVVSSLYLGYTALGGSATAWYLLADPQNIPTIAVAFLNGVETPTVETSQFDFDRLGLAMRAYMDWGCNKMEYRGGCKLKGAA